MRSLRYRRKREERPAGRALASSKQKRAFRTQFFPQFPGFAGSSKRLCGYETFKNPDGRICMFRRSRTTVLKEKATSGKDLAVALAQDKKFRKELISALGQGRIARRHAARGFGPVAVASRLAADQKLVLELRHMTENLQRAVTRAEQKRSHRLRNTLLIFGVGGAVLAIPQSRRLLSKLVRHRSDASTITESIEVGVPVSTAYQQWTQFEDFPLFMEGVDDVQQLDDTRLHWVATIAGQKAEWDAKIVEQYPDRLIRWVSEDGKKTRGTVTFEPRGDSRTLIRLSMGYQAGGPIEAVGSDTGLGAWRVRGDLERFKELIEGRGAETGARRSEASAGTIKQ